MLKKNILMCLKKTSDSAKFINNYLIDKCTDHGAGFFAD